MNPEITPLKSGDPNREMKLYLLGQLAPEEEQRIDERLFDDPAYFDEMSETETDLFDAYARGELPAEEARTFEQRFLASKRGQERLTFARALAARQSVVRTASSWRPWFLGTAIAAAIALCLGLGVLWRENRNLKDAIKTATQTAAARSHLAASAGANVLAVVLEPGEFRDASEAQSISLPADAPVVWLQLVLEDPSLAAPLAAELDNTGGQQVWAAQNMAPATRQNTRVLDVPLPTPMLRDGEYHLKLNSPSGKNAMYRFAVKRLDASGGQP